MGLALAAELVRPGGHGQPLGLLGVESALGTRHGLVLVVLEPFPPHVVIAVARLASQTRVLAVLVARLALERLRLDDLTGSLVLKLVVFAEEVVAKGALEDATPVIPHFSGKKAVFL